MTEATLRSNYQGVLLKVSFTHRFLTHSFLKRKSIPFVKCKKKQQQKTED